MHQCIKFILFWNDTLTYFGQSFRPSSGVQDCTYSNRHLSNRYCCLLASAYKTETGKHTWIKPDQVTFSKLAINSVILSPHNHPCSLHTFAYVQVGLISLSCYSCAFWWWNHNLTTILTSLSNTQWCPQRWQDATT